MKKNKDLNYLNKKISNRLLESIRLLDILETLIDGKAKEDILISIIKQNIKTSFNDIQDCRRMISFGD